MKKSFLYLILFCSFLQMTQAQVLESFGGYATISSVSSVSSTVFNCTITSFNGNIRPRGSDSYTLANIQVNDVVWSTDCNKFYVSTITSNNGITFVGRITSIDANQAPPSNNTRIALFREYVSGNKIAYALPPAGDGNSGAIAGITTGIKACIDGHYNKQDSIAYAAKQNTLVSGTTIKSLNGVSLLGSGNITINTGSGSTDLTKAVGPSDVSINSSSGTDIVLNAATSSNAGVMAASDKDKLNKLNNYYFDVRNYGITPDGGVTDYSTQYRNLLDTVTAKGGGTIFFPQGTYRINGKITYPVLYPAGVGTIPRQVNIHILGTAAHGTGNSQADNGYGTVILLGYNSASPTTTDTLCRWCFKGSGKVEISNITFRSADPIVYNTSFMQFTLTTSVIHDCAFVGSSASYTSNKDRREDVIEYGGKSYTEVLTVSDTAAFQGYGSVLRDNMFNRVQSGAVFNSLANAITVQNNWFSHHCGGIAAFRDIANKQVVGNNFISNHIEMPTYKYGFYFRSLTKGVFLANTFYDHGVGISASDYNFDDNSTYHTLIAGNTQAMALGIPIVSGTKKNTLNYYAVEQNDTTKLQTSFKIDADSRLYLSQNMPYVYNSAGDYITASIGNAPNVDFTFLKKSASGSEVGLLTFRDAGSSNTIMYSPNAYTSGTTYFDSYNMRLRASNELWLGSANNNYVIGGTFYNNATDAMRIKLGTGIYWTDNTTAAAAKASGLISTTSGTLRVVDGSNNNGILQTGSLFATARTGTATTIGGWTLANAAADITLGTNLSITSGVLNATTSGKSYYKGLNGTALNITGTTGVDLTATGDVGSDTFTTSDFTTLPSVKLFDVYINGIKAYRTLSAFGSSAGTAYAISTSGVLTSNTTINQLEVILRK